MFRVLEIRGAVFVLFACKFWQQGFPFLSFWHCSFLVRQLLFLFFLQSLLVFFVYWLNSTIESILFVQLLLFIYFLHPKLSLRVLCCNFFSRQTSCLRVVIGRHAEELAWVAFSLKHVMQECGILNQFFTYTLPVWIWLWRLLSAWPDLSHIYIYCKAQPENK